MCKMLFIQNFENAVGATYCIFTLWGRRTVKPFIWGAFCSSDTLFQRRSTELANHLTDCKYKDKIVGAQISKATSVPSLRDSWV